MKDSISSWSYAPGRGDGAHAPLETLCLRQVPCRCHESVDHCYLQKGQEQDTYLLSGTRMEGLASGKAVQTRTDLTDCLTLDRLLALSEFISTMRMVVTPST